MQNSDVSCTIGATDGSTASHAAAPSMSEDHRVQRSDDSSTNKAATSDVTYAAAPPGGMPIMLQLRNEGSTNGPRRHFQVLLPYCGMPFRTLSMHASKRALAEAIVAAFQKDLQPYVYGVKNTLELLECRSEVWHMSTNVRMQEFKYPPGYEGRNQHLCPPLEFVIWDTNKRDHVLYIYERFRSSNPNPGCEKYPFAFAEIYEASDS